MQEACLGFQVPPLAWRSLRRAPPSSNRDLVLHRPVDEVNPNILISQVRCVLNCELGVLTASRDKARDLSPPQSTLPALEGSLAR